MAKKQKWNVQSAPRQNGKFAVITGANSGLGYYTAMNLASLGADVIMAVRNTEKGESAASEIRKEIPLAKLHVLPLNLADLSSIRNFAVEYKKKFKKINILVNNAGVMMCPFQKTAEGFEMQFGTNHLGHFALTALLFSSIINETGSRIVSVSSFVHHFGKIDFEHLNDEKKYNKYTAYFQSKLANLLFTFELERRLKKNNSKIISVSAHPGYSNTNLQQHSGFFNFFNPFLAQSAGMGALPSLYAAVAADVIGGLGALRLGQHRFLLPAPNHAKTRTGAQRQAG